MSSYELIKPQAGFSVFNEAKKLVYLTMFENDMDNEGISIAFKGYTREETNAITGIIILANEIALKATRMRDGLDINADAPYTTFTPDLNFQTFYQGQVTCASSGDIDEGTYQVHFFEHFPTRLVGEIIKNIQSQFLESTEKEVNVAGKPYSLLQFNSSAVRNSACSIFKLLANAHGIDNPNSVGIPSVDIEAYEKSLYIEKATYNTIISNEQQISNERY